MKLLWEKIENGSATINERINAAANSGELYYYPSISNLKLLLDDEDELVRYYSLSSLVLHLKAVDDEYVRNKTIDMLHNDRDEDVRGMAAACIGSIYWNSKDLSVFNILKRVLLDSTFPEGVKESVYRAIFYIMGFPPHEWPPASTMEEEFDESMIDWEKMKAFENTCKEQKNTN